MVGVLSILHGMRSMHWRSKGLATNYTNFHELAEQACRAWQFVKIRAIRGQAVGAVGSGPLCNWGNYQTLDISQAGVALEPTIDGLQAIQIGDPGNFGEQGQPISAEFEVETKLNGSEQAFLPAFL